MPNPVNPATEFKLPSAHDWRTTDTDEINKRRLRAEQGSVVISDLEPRYPIFSSFRVKSGSGLTYSVEIRDVAAGGHARVPENGVGGPNSTIHRVGVSAGIRRQGSGVLRAAATGLCLGRWPPPRS
jgi:hypothetical protein